ncbi:MAG: cupin domain-containing protein [Candidatus Omnitrophica bacterium]|nr:cupin domain-containing protein [Candidatus Omnitrophota bacterium]MDE2009863.1 cupin domain-containing protein [Candidatus Omnitrophota bacterium]MDE2214355.1 cupin domain-containing protein [Candidatus Omnitrophota bacterium]MDE2231104.1 cupin domain-containing protein [Candidatus Omnitrophota bacterium]
MSPRIPSTAKQHSLDAPLLTFNLPELLSKIKGEDTWLSGQHNAMTLLEGRGLRIVLVAIKKGFSISAHQADCPISVQVLEGCINFNVDEEPVELKKGDLLTLHASLKHGCKAMEDSAFLLTLAFDPK